MLPYHIKIENCAIIENVDDPFAMMLPMRMGTVSQNHGVTLRLSSTATSSRFVKKNPSIEVIGHSDFLYNRIRPGMLCTCKVLLRNNIWYSGDHDLPVTRALEQEARLTYRSLGGKFHKGLCIRG